MARMNRLCAPVNYAGPMMSLKKRNNPEVSHTDTAKMLERFLLEIENGIEVLRHEQPRPDQEGIDRLTALAVRISEDIAHEKQA